VPLARLLLFSEVVIHLFISMEGKSSIRVRAVSMALRCDRVERDLKTVQAAGHVLHVIGKRTKLDLRIRCMPSRLF
jgi:hypothetical protein